MANIVEIVIKATDQTAGGIGGATANLGNISKTLTRTGTALTAGVTLPLMGMAAASINAASNLEQSLGGVESVFGDAQGAILEFGATADEIVGLSATRFNELAIVTGAFLQNLGYDAAAAADETIVLTSRAADMAATFGGPVDSALRAIQSGLKGEFNPLEQFGVKINMATINARALALGLEDAEGNLSDAAKATATLDLIMEQTAKTEGQFAKESDTLAGQTERTKAKFENAASALGTQLLPIALKVMEAVGGLVEKFTELDPKMLQIILVVGGIAAALGPLLLIVGSAISIFTTLGPVLATVAGILTGPVGLAIAAVIAAVGLLALAWKNNWGGIQEKTRAVLDWLQPKFQAVMDGLIAVFEWFKGIFMGVWEALKLAFSGDWAGFGEKLREVWDEVWNKIKEIGVKAWEGIKSFFLNTDWGEIGRSILRGVANGIKNGLRIITDAARNAARNAWEAAKGFLGIHSPSSMFAGIGENMMRGLAEGIDTFSKMPINMTVAATRTMMQGAGGAPMAPAMAMDNSRIVSLLEQMAGQRAIDEVRLSRLIRDAVLRETG